MTKLEEFMSKVNAWDKTEENGLLLLEFYDGSSIMNPRGGVEETIEKAKNGSKFSQKRLDQLTLSLHSTLTKEILDTLKVKMGAEYPTWADEVFNMPPVDLKKYSEGV